MGLCTPHGQVGIPDGVINVVTGLGPSAGAAVATHRGIDKVRQHEAGDGGRVDGRVGHQGLKVGDMGWSNDY